MIFCGDRHGKSEFKDLIESVYGSEDESNWDKF